jgi:hypothetical protein
MRLLIALAAWWHSWRASRHAMLYRYHLERVLDLRGRRA